MSVFYAESVARIPLGVATAIEFVGPLAVAVAATRRMLDVGWAGLAGLSVALITLTDAGWSGDPFGIASAIVTAACWAAYILLTKRIGLNFIGLHGLTISLSAASLVALSFGIAQLRPTATALDLVAAIALGIVVPLVPYGLEMLALKRLPARVFGILMSADPAISGFMGWLILQQTLSGQKPVGIVSVALASVGTNSARPSAEL